jgi:hypothetical protein
MKPFHYPADYSTSTWQEHWTAKRLEAKRRDPGPFSPENRAQAGRRRDADVPPRALPRHLRARRGGRAWQLRRARRVARTRSASGRRRAARSSGSPTVWPQVWLAQALRSAGVTCREVKPDRDKRCTTCRAACGLACASSTSDDRHGDARLPKSAPPSLLGAAQRRRTLLDRSMAASL